MDEEKQLELPTYELLLKRAWLLYDNQLYKAAISELHVFLVHDPDHSEAYSLLSLCYGEIEDNEKIAAAKGVSEALRVAVEGIKKSPDKPLAYFAHAIAFEKLNRLKRAEAGIREALRLDPENVAYHGVLSRIQLRSGSWMDGLESAQRGLSYDPESTQCILFKSIALYEMGRLEEASSAALHLLSINPESPGSHGILGLVEYKKGRLRPAIDHFQTALKLDSSMNWVVEANIMAQKESTLFYRLVAAPVLWVTDRPAWMVQIVVIGGWICTHLAPRLAKGHPLRVLPVAGGLLIYFLLNTVVRLGDPLLNRLVPISRLSSKKFEISNVSDWDAVEIAYLLSLAFLPVAIVWPHGLALSVFADLFLFIAICADTAESPGARIFVFIIFAALDYWIRG